MTKKVFDFFSSFGIMLAGLSLLFVSSVSFYKTSGVSFPRSGERELVGGDIEVQTLPISHPSVPLKKGDAKIFFDNLTAKTVLVVDDRTDTILWEKNLEEIRSLASITKLMSALVILDLPIQWSTTTKITDEDNWGGSQMVQVGEKFTAEELWKIALVGSSNNALSALVRLSGLSNDDFVIKMNEKAKSFRLNSLVFDEPTGLSSKNRGKAKDIARLLKIALQQEKIYSALQTPEYYVVMGDTKKQRRIWNTNWLLTKWIPSSFSQNQIVGKTGFIGDSGYNFVVRFETSNEKAVRVLILGAVSNEARFTEARDLASWAFNNHLWPGDVGYTELVE